MMVVAYLIVVAYLAGFDPGSAFTLIVLVVVVVLVLDLLLGATRSPFTGAFGALAATEWR
jgi:hypothetical protein